MNTTTNFYKGLTNDDTIDDLTVGSLNCGTFNVNSITASHYYGIITEVINTSMLFPEIGFSFDPAVNTFSIYLYDDSIPLARLSASTYDSLAVPRTLVWRDDDNFSEMYELRITNLLTVMR